MQKSARNACGLLAQWRNHAGLTRAQVAERMGVSAPTVSRMEANITRASLDTLTRYALVCGVKHPQITLISKRHARWKPACQKQHSVTIVLSGRRDFGSVALKSSTL